MNPAPIGFLFFTELSEDFIRASDPKVRCRSLFAAVRERPKRRIPHGRSRIVKKASHDKCRPTFKA